MHSRKSHHTILDPTVGASGGVNHGLLYAKFIVLCPQMRGLLPVKTVSETRSLCRRRFFNIVKLKTRTTCPTVRNQQGALVALATVTLGNAVTDRAMSDVIVALVTFGPPPVHKPGAS
jgi:hypothetical protein